MNFIGVYRALRELEATPGKKDKQALVAHHLENGLFGAVCQYAYDPFITFGILPELDTPCDADRPSTPTEEEFFGLLDTLKNRESTGHAARDLVDTALNGWDPEVARLLIHVLNKDLRAGFGVSTLNKAKPGFIYVFTTMLAHAYKKSRITAQQWETGVAGQPKLDGYRCNARYLDGKVEFFSREGHTDFATMPFVEAELIKVGEVSDLAMGRSVPIWFDGELKVPGNFNNNGALRRKNNIIDDVDFTLFEILTQEEFKKGSDSDHQLRRRYLVDTLAKVPDLEFVRPIEERIVHSHEEVMEWFGQELERGSEGLVIKPLDGKYEPKRSYNWLKVKNKMEGDFLCVGLAPGKAGTKRAETFGAFWVMVDDVKVKVPGIKEKLLKQITKDPSIVVGKIIQVKFHEFTPDGSLRHPRLGPKGIRNDKSIPDTRVIIEAKDDEE